MTICMQATVNPNTIVPIEGQFFCNLGGNCRGTPAACYWGNALFAFVRNADKSLGLCAPDASGTASWRSIPGALSSSPAVAAAPNGCIGVIALMENQQIAISYIQPFQGSHTAFTVIGGQIQPVKHSNQTPVLAVSADQRLWAFASDINGHIWQTMQLKVGPIIDWSNWSLIDAKFTTNANFSIFLNNTTWCLQIVALGMDNLMYQASQSRENDDWEQFQLIGTGDPQFVNGASACMSASADPCYAAYNANMQYLNAALLFCSPENAAWTALTISQQQQPLPTSIPLLIANNGTPQLLFQNIPGQILLISQSILGTGFWKEPQTIGMANPGFSGNLGAVANAGKVAIFSPSIDGNLYFINFDPGTSQSKYSNHLSRLLQKAPASLKHLINNVLNKNSR